MASDYVVVGVAQSSSAVAAAAGVYFGLELLPESRSVKGNLALGSSVHLPSYMRPWPTHSCGAHVGTYFSPLSLSAVAVKW